MNNCHCDDERRHNEMIRTRNNLVTLIYKDIRALHKVGVLHDSYWGIQQALYSKYAKLLNLPDEENEKEATRSLRIAIYDLISACMAVERNF